MLISGTGPAGSILADDARHGSTARQTLTWPWRLAGRPGGEGLPAPYALAAVGTVLCLHRPTLGDALAGWRHASRAAVRQRLDSDGLDESLWFFDAQGAGCWRLCLLPDSDFLAWDALLEGLPEVEETPATGLAERLWRRLARRDRGEHWSVVPLRLHARGHWGGELVATVASLSDAGRRTAERLAQRLDD